VNQGSQPDKERAEKQGHEPMIQSFDAHEDNNRDPAYGFAEIITVVKMGRYARIHSCNTHI